MHKLSGVFLLALLMVFFTSCSSSRKLASGFVSGSSLQTGVYLRPAGYIEKVNMRRFPSTVFEGLSRDGRDSLRLAQSLFLKNISDSVFLELFFNAYLEEMNALGLRVCLEPTDSLACPPLPESYSVSVEQMELREFVLRMTDEQYIYNALYQKDFELNALSLHVGFGITRYGEKPGERVLYAENYISDDVRKSGFGEDRNSGKILHYNDIDRMNHDKVYHMATALGRKYASFTYDYLMNAFVYRSLKGKTPGVYYHYDRFRGRIVPAEDNRFKPE